MWESLKAKIVEQECTTNQMDILCQNVADMTDIFLMFLSGEVEHLDFYKQVKTNTKNNKWFHLLK